LLIRSTLHTYTYIHTNTHTHHQSILECLTHVQPYPFLRPWSKGGLFCRGLCGGQTHTHTLNHQPTNQIHYLISSNTCPLFASTPTVTTTITTTTNNQSIKHTTTITTNIFISFHPKASCGHIHRHKKAAQ
ncbi:hypothetical protein SAMD00019534_107320, partial [Acytostelium subglobosum LB1]|uniref:hypothetical protein n=1 Tax=Acytostelium subglobosum LB1 TaxID=1410327 RepID=UPI000644CD4C